MQINEGSSGVYVARLMMPQLDEDGAPVLADGAPVLVPVPRADVDSLKLTLSDQQTGTVINDRDAQECVPFGGASGVRMEETSGWLTWMMTGDDSVVVTSTKRKPVIEVLLVVRVGDTQLTHVEEITVLNLAKYPAA